MSTLAPNVPLKINVTWTNVHHVLKVGASISLVNFCFGNRVIHQWDWYIFPMTNLLLGHWAWIGFSIVSLIIVVVFNRHTWCDIFTLAYSSTCISINVEGLWYYVFDFEFSDIHLFGYMYVQMQLWYMLISVIFSVWNFKNDSTNVFYLDIFLYT